MTAPQRYAQPQYAKGLTRTSRLDDPTLAALNLAGSY
jgi:hypothetical protein